MSILDHFYLAMTDIRMSDGTTRALPALVYGDFAITPQWLDAGYVVTHAPSGRCTAGQHETFDTLEAAARFAAFLIGLNVSWEGLARNPDASTKLADLFTAEDARRIKIAREYWRATCLAHLPI